MLRRAFIRNSLHLTCMTTTTCLIPKSTIHGVFDDVPFEAWDEIRDLVRDEFDGVAVVHDHKFPGSFHGRAFFPVPHYLLEIQSEEEDLGKIQERVNPLLEKLIDRYRRTVDVPAER